ncbi:hypothetical protein NKI13_16655 [Mesorhizobium australicum]|uniref:hypothetical protein n=1 Tax=Mesorhizobium australicum TaxID=536018 RepID=UPI00333B9E1C
MAGVFEGEVTAKARSSQGHVEELYAAAQLYDVRLDDNTRISIDDDVARPHLVGSLVPIERQHHKHDVDTYPLLNG